VKVYVDGGHAITTVSILKIQVNYGGNSHTKGILEKLKDKGRPCNNHREHLENPSELWRQLSYKRNSRKTKG
jgi:hypothetical protein